MNCGISSAEALEAPMTSETLHKKSIIPKCSVCSCIAFSHCDFCMRKLCLNCTSGRRDNEHVCLQCNKQIALLQSRARPTIETFLLKDPTTIVVSYLCAYDIMAMCPMWGFLSRIKPVGYGCEIRYRPLYMVYRLPECKCWIQASICHRFWRLPDDGVIRYDPYLYSDKPESYIELATNDFTQDVDYPFFGAKLNVSLRLYQAMLPTVVRIRRQGGQVVQDCDVYIGREQTQGDWDLSRSIWANPFKVKECKNVHEACSAYESHVRKSPELMKKLPELRGRRLGCWCERKKKCSTCSKNAADCGHYQCHGDVLVKLCRESQDSGKQMPDDIADELYG